MSEEKKTRRDFLKEPYPWNLLHSIQAGRDIILPEEITDEIQAGIDYVISRLDAREQEIIRRRYLEGQTLSEIGSVLGVIQERVRQIEVKCLQKLSKPRCMQYIRYGIQGVVQRHSDIARKQGYDKGYNDGYRQALDDTKNGIEKEGVSVNILSLPIEALCLPNRTCTCLTDAGFSELRDLLNLDKSELKKITGLTVDRRCEVAGALSKYGLCPEGWHDHLILWEVRNKKKVEEKQDD